MFEELVETYVPSMTAQVQHLSMMSLISLSWFLTIFLRSLILLLVIVFVIIFSALLLYSKAWTYCFCVHSCLVNLINSARHFCIKKLSIFLKFMQFENIRIDIFLAKTWLSSLVNNAFIIYLVYSWWHFTDFLKSVSDLQFIYKLAVW